MNNSLSSEELNRLADAAITAAQVAGRWIESQDKSTLRSSYKESGSSEASQIVTEVDLGSEEIIRSSLEPFSSLFNIAFVGEESSLTEINDPEERFRKPYFWCVDPLDGTLAFAEGRSGYAVSIALVEQSGSPIIGVVYDPASENLYHAIVNAGSFYNGESMNREKPSRSVLRVYADSSFKKHPRYETALSAVETCASTLGVDDIDYVYGSGAVKNACGVIESDQACYFKLPKRQDGGGSIWDFAATSCLAMNSGAWASDINGDPLVFNSRDSNFMNQKGVVFASNEWIAKLLIESFSSFKGRS